ncbi:unnamed protein product [Aphanomyces euteiches]|uniref:Uncharacterized protein n=1 Tax=Aphanomyces euteiches TaxID=100861 RepID=A0A6G0W823_9STRA|nr:hypothetical protein Ae201684_017741 [Aphanomyces euteiches]KAH9064766.1 hypothetical protein Ae201684P_003549 [Aphanomyces euteiches]KAH9145070.1 hypothetical protein AeRB84_010991 [Aphanomyces euteiches]
MDAFAGLDPLGGKPKAAPAYSYPIQPQVNNPVANISQTMSSGLYPPQMPPAGFPQQMQQGMYPPQMPQGLNMGMAPQASVNMGMAPPSGINMGMPQMNMPQQQAPPAQPIMYDSIKNLLQKKPDQQQQPLDTGADPFSCFTGGAKPSSRTNSATMPAVETKRTNSCNVAGLDPFSSPTQTASTSQPAVNLSIFGESTSSGSNSNITTSASTPKNSALADRLRGGKRQTQEAQRANLSIVSTAVSTGGTSVSIKKQLGSTQQQPPQSTTTQTAANDSLLGF